MKKTVFAFCMITLLQPVMAQNNEGATLDLLKAPASPASNLLGFATTDIEKPTDVSSLMLSLQSASNAFTKLPSNYALDISPYFLISRRTDFTTKGLNSTKFSDVLRQSFVLSFAIKNPDSAIDNFKSTSTYGGLGFKFSFLRPQYDKESQKVVNNLTALQGEMNIANMKSLKAWKTSTDPVVLQLNARRDEIFDQNNQDKIVAMQNDSNSELNKIERRLGQLLAKFTAEDSAAYKKSLLDKLQTEAAKFKGIREGFSWDLAGGVSGEFLNKQFDNSRVFNAGLWTTVGYTGKKGSAILGLVRYLHNPDQIFAKDNAPNEIGNISTLDAGLRGVYSNDASRFNCSVEAIYRSALSSNTIDPSWRLIFNADYSLFKNQKLTFSFGRNFDGTVTKDGNLVAALTFLAGFGNKR
jgi:hypothetical protein